MSDGGACVVVYESCVGGRLASSSLLISRVIFVELMESVESWSECDSGCSIDERGVSRGILGKLVLLNI